MGTSERQLLARFGADLSPLEKAIVSATSKMSQFGKDVADLGKALSAAITVPLVGLGTAAITSSETIDEAFNKIKATTGATGDTLKGLQDDFLSIYGTVPASSQAVATAVSDLHQRLGLTGDALDATATQMLNLAKVTGSDVAPLITDASKVFSAWQVDTKAQSGELDTLFKVSQQSGVGMQQLLGSLALGGPAFRAMGLSVDQSALLLGNFEKAGVSSESAIAAITKAARDFAKEGVNMGDGLRSVLQQIKDAPSPTAAAEIAATKFGKSAIAVADAVRNGGFDIDAFSAKVAASTSTINATAEKTRTLSDTFQMLQERVTKALAPLGDAIKTVILTDVVPMLQKGIDIIGSLVQAFVALPQPVQDGVIVIAALAAAVGPALIALGGLIVGVSKVVTSFLSLKAAIGPAMEGFTGLFSGAAGIVETATGAMSAVWASATGALALLAEGVGVLGAALLAIVDAPVTLFIAAIGAILAVWTPGRDALVAVFGAIKQAASDAWNWIATETPKIWSNIVSTVQSIFSGLVGMVTALGSALVSAANVALAPFGTSVQAIAQAVVDGLSKAWDWIKSSVTAVATWLSSQMQSLIGSMPGWVSSIVSALIPATNAVTSLIALLSRAASMPMPAVPSAPSGGGGGGDGSSAPSGGGPAYGTAGYGTGAYGTAYYSPGAGAPGAAAPARVSGGVPGTPPPPAPGANTSPPPGTGTNSMGATSQTVGFDPFEDAPTGGPTSFTGWTAQPGTQGGAPVTRLTPAQSGLPAQPAAPKGAATAGAGGTTEWWDPGYKGPGIVDYGGTPGFGAYGGTAIPMFANGGIVNRPGGMLAQVGEAGPEAVIPLAKLGAVMGSLGGMSPARGGGNVTLHVHVHASGSVAAKRDFFEEFRSEAKKVQRRNGSWGPQ